jgi:uncharacterized protein YcbX
MASNFTVTHLLIYPIKGLSGVAVNESFVTSRGLQYDRRWMLIDENNQFISQRTFPNLCLFKVEIKDQGFSVTFNSNSVFVPLEIKQGQTVLVKIWDDQVEAILADNLINDFFSEHLQIKCSLVYMPDSSNRRVDESFVKQHNTVSFADGYPVLLIGQESLNLLNSKLNEPIEMNRFRPNIVFEGGTAHIEDLMIKFRIAEVEFQGIKPCARCQVPTIDQQTAIISKEPTKTLASYRKFGNKINFGQNIIVMHEGTIRVSDKIVLEN